MKISYDLAGEKDTLNHAAFFSTAVPAGCIIFMQGDLGTGKTTWVRGFLQAQHVKDNVKSPTYTLVEVYDYLPIPVYHFDLYRLANPEELEFMGIRDYLLKNSIALIEWPERAQGIIKFPDLVFQFNYKELGRELIIEAKTQKGENTIKLAKDKLKLCGIDNVE
ncbi:MAG: tRNA ((37)-N6)-threonylcarbamoyltransferase complex ATPase subunit type 1 TsaE [Francisellaceae bacterium]|nr:tRNA ((37)-N6)-threonylcarbamoyltransferase complex ATPase subunit type 1 TsaE [Francisellaceae bacterium]